MKLFSDMKKTRACNLRCLLVAALACVSAAVEAQRVVFMPQFDTQSQFAGYYAASELGYYREAGLNVRFKRSDPFSLSVTSLYDRRCDIVTSEAITALVAMEKMPPLVNILQTSQHCTLMVVARKPGVKSLRDLRGCRVGTWKSGFSELPRLVDYIYQTGIKWIETTDVVGLYASGAVDAILVKSYNEKVQIDMSNLCYGSSFSFRGRGYDIPEDGVYVTYEYYQQHPMECKAFADASLRGWKWVRANKEKALDIVMKYAERDGVRTSRTLQRVQLDSIIEQQKEKSESKPSFQLNKKSYEWLSELLYQYGFVNKKTNYSKFTKEK